MTGASLDDLKRSALALHQAGKLAEAEAAYRAALALAAGDTDCLHMLGVLRYQRGRFADALQLIDRARAAKPANLGAIDFNRAMVVSGILGRCASTSESPSVAGVTHPRCTRVDCAAAKVTGAAVLRASRNRWSASTSRRTPCAMRASVTAGRISGSRRHR